MNKYIVEDFIKTALTNDFTYIGVNDYSLFNKYRSNGVRQMRVVKDCLAFAYDTLGNRTIVTLDGKVIQL
jgi:hypothetical protein